MRKAFTVSLLLVAVLGVLLVMLFAATIYTYERLTAETLIAELRFETVDQQEYRAHLRTGDRCDERTFTIYGDQWRVDAEFLKWKYWAALFGLDGQYRLDRLEGRYRNVAEQNASEKLAYDLGVDTAIDITGLAAALGPWNFLVDATYGTSTYQDIDVGNVYYVYRTTSGIITRFEPLPPVPSRSEALAINVDRACGKAPSAWQRSTAWLNARAINIRDFAGRLFGS